MNQLIIKTFIIAIITVIAIGCSNNRKTSDSTNTTGNEIVNTMKTPNDDQTKGQEDANDSYTTTPNTSNIQKCSVCNGGGVVTWYDGSLVSCPSCNGTGLIDLQQVMNEAKSSMNNGSEGMQQSGRTSRSREEIATDINKTTQMLNDNIETLTRLQNNNESVTLSESYQQMISQNKERLYNLNIEYNSAAR